MSVEHGTGHEKVNLPTIERHERVAAHTPEKPRDAEALKLGEVRDEVHEALEAKKTLLEAEKAPHGIKNREQHIISPKQKDRAYKHIMRDIQKDMPNSTRAFSKFIHHPAVDAASEVVGQTVARPTSILYGSFCAFIVLLGTYLLAKHNGFELSGFEFIGLFIAGWVIGLIADLMQHMITGKN